MVSGLQYAVCNGQLTAPIGGLQNGNETRNPLRNKFLRGFLVIF